MKKLILIIFLISTLTSCTGYNFYDILTSLGAESPNLARNLSFMDEDYLPNVISGTFKFLPALNEGNITEYRIYFGSSASTKNSSTPISTLTPNGSIQTVIIPSTPTAGATHLLIYSVKGTDEMPTPSSLLIKDLVVEPLGMAETNPGGFIIIDGVLYFAAKSVASGSELYKSHGTLLGTSGVTDPLLAVLDIDPVAAADGFPTSASWAVGVNGKIAISASSRTTPGPVYDQMLFVIDPLVNIVQNGVYPYYDTFTNPAAFDLNPALSGSSPSKPVVIGNKIFFTADDGTNGRELWVLDTSDPYDLPVYDYTTNPAIIDINTSAGVGSSPDNLTAYNGKLYFTADDGINGIELWVLDPAVAIDNPVTGVTNPILINIHTVALPSNPMFLTVFNNKLYFQATQVISGTQLWVLDSTLGISPGPLYNVSTNPKLINLYPGGNSTPKGITVFNNKLIFAATDLLHGEEPWISDGTLSGSYMLRDMNSGIGSSLIGTTGMPFVSDNKIFMSLTVDPLDGNQLGVTDGTSSGTFQIMIGTAGASYPSNPQYFASLNGMVYFVADKGLGDGLQIFRTDGTFSDTVQLTTAALLNNNPVNKPKELTTFNNKIFFTGTNAAGTITELYVLYFK